VGLRSRNPGMAKERQGSGEEIKPLTTQDSTTATPSARTSLDSVTSASTASLVLEQLNGTAQLHPNGVPLKPTHDFEYRDNEDDLELPRYLWPADRSAEKRTKRLVSLIAAVGLGGWIVALVLFLLGGRYNHPSTLPYDHETPSKLAAKKVTLAQVQSGWWYPRHHAISWIAGANGEDGLLLEQGQARKDFLVVEDVRNRKEGSMTQSTVTLIKDMLFEVNGERIQPDEVWPSPDLKRVLVMSDRKHNWRHSFTGRYWIFDVATQKGQPLDPVHPDERLQLASWSPASDSVVFTRGNNMFLRILPSAAVRQITVDGGEQLFYGVPDWVYEEEVFQSNSVTWTANDGQYIAFLRTNESAVPEYPVQYFLSRPSGEKPAPGEEAYPEVRQIKYPKAGAPNPTVDLQFYDVARAEVFSVDISGGFADDDRLIIEVLWVGPGKVLVRETNRESDSLRLVLIDVTSRSGKVVRTQDVAALDGGWVEPTQATRFVPADPANGRPADGYIDTVIHGTYDHLAYFSPLDSSTPIMLTSGDWEVVNAPSAVDLKNNLVYFVATKEAPTERHVYSVKLDGSDLKAMVPTDTAYYDVSFSKGAGYALLTNSGPGIPSQKVINTPSNSDHYEDIIEENKQLANLTTKYELPHLVFQTVTIDGFTLQVVEQRPPHFDSNREYPVLFHLYGGPNSQTVDRRFKVDFQSYIASNLDYIVVTVDGRGTGFIGREARCIIRGNLGYYEAHDQIETAKIWAKKPYVDPKRIAIWGWSYGGFMTLKTLEQDAGQTFRYGMAVAPVTDWRYYDSVYTERYMHTPQRNPNGYDSSAISNMTALGQNVRFLLMHGVADDNVHLQNSLTLLDKLDLAGIENYDVHVFPDSDHGISFHNANNIVFDRKFRDPLTT
jgi:dipeptidyl aminopeptidase B